MQPDPLFIPKINSWFHRAQEIVLPSLCPNASHPKEREWHMMDVWRALKYYLERTKALQKTDALFCYFQGPAMGRKASTRILGGSN